MNKDRVGGPYLLVLAGTAAGIVGLLLGLPASASGVIVGVPILGGALLRWLRPDAGAGDLASRSKGVDVLVLGLLGGALVVSGLLFLVPWTAS
jgi:hypothetical protein